MKETIGCIFFLWSMSINTVAQLAKSNRIIQIVFTSDAHYGIKRPEFRGKVNVEASIVNEKMIEKINTITAIQLPKDSGINAGKKIDGIDYLIQGGDITNRMEIPFQNAAVSWTQFEKDYINGITLKDRHGNLEKLLLIPGNHDATNAVGFYKPMNPVKDPTSMVEMYNLMMKPVAAINNNNFDYLRDKINYSKNIGGIHFLFLQIWPDSLERIWMENDLQTIPLNTPVIIFTHDQPESEAKHFSNPIPCRGINAEDKFEELLSEQYKEGDKVNAHDGVTVLEQHGWVNFLKLHPNIKAYFHGNSNYNEYYVYKGPDADIALNTFRVDSPMKGKNSLKDETKLSFQLITIDTKSGLMTVRECLWNTDPLNPEKPVKWGDCKTVSLKK